MGCAASLGADAGGGGGGGGGGVSVAPPAKYRFSPIVPAFAPGQPRIVDFDLGTPHFIRSARLRLLPAPPGGPIEAFCARRRVCIRLSNNGGHEHRTGYTCESEEDAEGWVHFPHVQQCARRVWMQVAGTPAGTAVQISGIGIDTADAWGSTLVASFRRAFDFHSSKNLFGCRRSSASRAGEDADIAYVWCTFGSILRRVEDFARGLALATAAANVSSAEAGVGLMARNSPEWMIAQLACWVLGRPVIAIASTTPAAHLPSMLEQGRAEVLVTDRTDLAGIVLKDIRLTIQVGGETQPAADGAQTFGCIESAGKTSTTVLPLLGTDAEDRIALVLFTSGSSGRPKGVARTCRELSQLLQAFSGPQHAVHLSVLPLSSLSESVIVPSIIFQGGQVGFCDSLQDVLGELQILRPTLLSSAPRFFEVVHGLYDDAVDQLVAAGESPESAR
eukprot:SAG22_NODE_337_length_12043_cov_58.339556_7_plen_447_part_00